MKRNRIQTAVPPAGSGRLQRFPGPGRGPTAPKRALFPVLLIAAGLLSFPPAGRAEQAAATAAAGIKNVLIIVLDSLQADHLGVYGYPRITSPNLDRLGREGLVFNRAIVQAGWSKPSVLSLFTSIYPSVHRVLNKEDVFPENLTTVAEIFRDNGYFTIGLINNIHITAESHYDRGFAVYDVRSDDDIFSSLRNLLAKGYLDGIDARWMDETKTEELLRFLKTAGERNLLHNPGFEAGREGWACQTDWLAAEGARSGGSSAHIDKNGFPASNFWHLNQRLTLQSGCDYLVGAFIKTKNLRDHASLEIWEINNRNHPYTQFGYLTGDRDWTLLMGVFTPEYCGDNYETKVEIRPGRINGFQEGEWWVDDVFVIPIRDLPRKNFFRPADKVFVYAHLLDPHPPYYAPPSDLELFKSGGEITPRDRYDGEIRAQDAKLGLLIDTLASRGILDETLLVITADHGEGFNEHGWSRYKHDVFYDERTRVPLIIFNPRLFPAPVRVEWPVQASVDLLPSLVELLGLRVPAGTHFQGASFFPLDRLHPPYAFYYEGPCLRMVTDRGWKYISLEHYRFVGGAEVWGEYLKGSGTKIRVISPSGEETSELFPAAEDLRRSKFYHSFGPEVQAGIIDVFQAADPRPTGQPAREKPLLFDLENDPGEKIDLTDRYPEKVRYFQRIIREQIAADRAFGKNAKVAPGGKREITDSMRKELRALGYPD